MIEQDPIINAVLKQVYQYPTLTEKDLAQVMQAHQILEIKKGTNWLKAGQISKSYAIVLKGLLRSVVIDAVENEITTNFFGPNELVIEVSSLFAQRPTQETIQAITDCTIISIDFDTFQELFINIPSFAEWGRMWMTFALTQQKERMLDMLTKTANERYLQLLSAQPHVIQTAPLKYIATYLGITDTSLSRIRKELSK